MEATMNELCIEKHKNIDATLDSHSQQLEKHGDRLDKLENGQVRTETIVQNVCERMNALTTAIWWFFGLLLTGSIGFIIWYIQTLR